MKALASRRHSALLIAAAALAMGACCAHAGPQASCGAASSLASGEVDIGGGVVLHYVTAGKGIPVVFVHGSLSDYSYWCGQVAAFGRHYRAIAYSRRYDFPNSNAPVLGYSAKTDADDLGAIIAHMHLGKVYVIGHSYGALTALFLAANHPELLRAVVLAEPPAISILRHLPDEEASVGRAMYSDIFARMVTPMRADFLKGDANAGVGAFIDYVFDSQNAWSDMSGADRAATMRDAREWEVMMTHGTLFPDITPQTVHSVRVPVMIMSGAKSYPFLAYIDQELARLLPDNVNVIYPDVGHQMWVKYPNMSRNDAEAFFRKHPD